MEDRNIAFQEYIESYKNMDDDDKKEALIHSVKEIIAMFEQLSNKSNIPLQFMHSNEILDLNKENVSNSDFLEALFVYLEISKDLIGQYIVKSEK